MISIADEIIKICTQKSTFHGPLLTPHLEIVFWLALPHSSTDFIKKRCQIVQEIILYQIQGSPKEFETSPIYKCIGRINWKFWFWFNLKSSKELDIHVKR